MGETKIKFHNKVKIRVQMQLFAGSTLVGTCVAGPGEVCLLVAEATRYDIYFKDGTTGWEIARKLNSEIKTITLNQNKGRYVLS